MLAFCLEVDSLDFEVVGLVERWSHSDLVAVGSCLEADVVLVLIVAATHLP